MDKAQADKIKLIGAIVIFAIAAIVIGIQLFGGPPAPSRPSSATPPTESDSEQPQEPVQPSTRQLAPS